MNTMRERTVEDLLSRELDVFENAIADENKALAICSREKIWNIVYRIVKQELKKEREEIVNSIVKDVDMTDQQLQDIINIIKNKYDKQ